MRTFLKRPVWIIPTPKVDRSAQYFLCPLSPRMGKQGVGKVRLGRLAGVLRVY